MAGVLLSSALALLTGCSSLVVESDARDASIDAGSDGDAAVDGATGAEGTAGTGTASTSGTNANGSSAAGPLGSRQPGAGAAPGTVSSGGAVVSGRGFSRTEIRVGFPNAPDINAVAAAFGLQGGTVGDLPTQMAALADYVNKRGGILGRRLTYVQHDIAVQDSSDPATTDQAACADWTEDHTVFAVVSPLGAMSPQLRQCLYAAKTALVVSPTQLIPKPEYDARPTMLFAPGYMSTDRYYRLWAARLAAQRFFTGWDIQLGRPGPAAVKIGYVGTDDPDTSYRLSVLKRELAKFGLKVSATATFPPTADGINAGTQNAVLRFRSEGITHVVGATLMFFRGAENQRYYPRYGITFPAALTASNTPASQLHGSMGAGLTPNVDVGAAHQPKERNSAQRLCESIMRAAGQWTNTTDQTAIAYMYFECDSVFMLANALNAAGVMSLGGLRTGVESLGAGWVSAATFTSSFGPGQHAAATSLRDFTYVDSCSCFAYTNSVNHRDTT